jgi:predicted permease
MNASELWLRLKSIFQRKRLDQNLQDEMAFHLAMKQEKLRAQGVAEDDLRAASLRNFGNLMQATESSREAWMFVWLENLAQDLRYAGRMLRKAPALTAVVVISLALGIGANTAIYSVLDSVLMQSLPIDEPQQLVMLSWSSKNWPERVLSDQEGSSYRDSNTGWLTSYSFSQQVFEYVRDHNHSFESTVAAAANIEEGNIGLNSAAHPAQVSAVSGNFFEGIRVVPAAGRVLGPSDDTAGGSSVAMVSYRFWQKYMSGDASAMGRKITINGNPMTVVGVAPPDFFGVEPGTVPDVWVPLSYYVAEFMRVDHMDLKAPKVWYLQVFGRRKPGVSEEQSRTEVKLLCDQALNIGTAEVPRDDKVPTFGLISAARGIDGLRRQFSTSLYLLMGMVGLVLLIACANVAGLLLAKATSRRQEIAVRISLGAPRSRLIRQLLTESVVLAVCGGAAGLAVAYYARGVLVTLIQSGRGGIEVPPHSDTRVLLFTLAVSVISGIFFGLAPAFRGTRTDVNSALKQSGGRTATSRSAFRAGKILVSGQVALCLLLLIGAGLLVRTLRRLQTVDLGFDRENLVSFRVFPGLNGYTDARLIGYYDELERRIAAIPGVRSVGLTQIGPVGQGSSSTVGVIFGSSAPDKRYVMYRHKVSPGYFETLHVPLLLGRDFTDQDTEASEEVAIVNQRFVRDYMKGDNPIGRQFDTGSKTKPRIYTIVGVVGDVKYARIREEAPPTFYLPYKQDAKYATFMTYLVRTASDPRGVTSGIQQEALRVSKDVPVVGMKTEAEVIDSALFVERIFAVLSASFGGLALLLACVGLYGTIGYTVTQRTNEIGVRMALGATRERILGMIVSETVVVVVAGIMVGLPLTWYATQVLKAQLFGLSPHDASTILCSLAAILAVTIISGLQPARRAAKVDPMVALRYE